MCHGNVCFCLPFSIAESSENLKSHSSVAAGTAVSPLAKDRRHSTQAGAHPATQDENHNQHQYAM